jgi:hypothetical protein
MSMGWRRVAVAVLAVLAVLAPMLPGPAVAAPSSGLEGVPQLDHIVVLMLENESASSTFGPGSPATYLNGLRAEGTFVPGYYGTAHLSLTNYIAIVSGQPANPLTISDCATVSLYLCAQTTTLFANGRHLGDQLDAVGRTWKTYLDGAPTPCFHGPYSSSLTGLLTPDPFQGDSQTPPAKDYADRHNPFLYFPNVVGNQSRCDAHLRPVGELSTDLAADTLPAFSFITPDTCHDGHDDPCSNGTPGGLVSADLWLREVVPPLVTYLRAHNGLLVINFDEGDFDLPGGLDGLADLVCVTCASLGLGGRTGAVLVGAGVPAGKTVTASYDHYSLLRTVEDAFGINEHLNLAALAAPMVEVFAP